MRSCQRSQGTAPQQNDVYAPEESPFFQALSSEIHTTHALASVQYPTQASASQPVEQASSICQSVPSTHQQYVQQQEQQQQQQVQHPFYEVASQLEDSPLPTVFIQDQILLGPALSSTAAAALNPSSSINAQGSGGAGVLGPGYNSTEYQQCKQVSHIIPRNELQILAPLRGRDARQVGATVVSFSP